MSRSQIGFPNQQVTDLLNMLSYKRRGGSKGELEFIRRFVLPLGALSDGFGNHWLRIGESPILFSSHTDTVHRSEGNQAKALRYSKSQGFISIQGSECLGADCGTGVWLMREMILAKIPGLYVFHAQEETGGEGSLYVAEKTPEKLKDIKIAIAFDRMGEEDIITHQTGHRCCSDAFAVSLKNLLAMSYKNLAHGTFTDTANYTHLIPECTNISVGYHNAHQKSEYQDMWHALALRNSLIRADWSKLVVERDPAEVVTTWRSGKTWKDARTEPLGGGLYGGYGGWRLGSYKIDPLLDYVRLNPTAVKNYLVMLGIEKSDIEEFARSGMLTMGKEEI